MVLTFSRDVAARLRAIEDEEGVPDVELVHQAVAVWSVLTADERRILGLAAMQLVVARHWNGGAS